MELSSQQIAELSEFYWETDIATVELQKHFGLPKPVHLYISPYITDVECPNCFENLVFKSRSARNSDEKICTACGHKARSIYLCQCDHCRAIKQEEQRKRRIDQERREAEALKNLIEETSSPEYVSWAITKLTRREKIFLRSLLEILHEKDSATWEEICDRAKVVSHKKYVDKLLKVNLLHQHPNGISPNPRVDAEMINVKKVRNITKSLRFNVLQRDGHTCQYCGRKPPDVELEIDHLLPVAEGGTDEFENLVTSCFDCNRGKSAKIIQNFTGGYSKDEWRSVIREKRLQTLQARREQLEEITNYWAERRNTSYPSNYDLKAIHSFIEIYDPDWIKAAIYIATQQKRSNYVKYVAGILRNWGQNGPPEHIANSDLTLQRKAATQKQKDYIKSLLENLELSLEDFYHKTDYDELTMLDAKHLLDSLTDTLSEDIDAA